MKLNINEHLKRWIKWNWFCSDFVVLLKTFYINEGILLCFVLVKINIEQKARIYKKLHYRLKYICVFGNGFFLNGRQTTVLQSAIKLFEY